MTDRTPPPKLEYPSHRFGLITRVKNKIADAIEHESTNYETVREDFEIMVNRIHDFVEICTKEVNKVGVSQDLKDDFSDQYIEKLKPIYEFRSVVENWLKLKEQEGQKIEANDSISVAGSKTSNGSNSSRSSMSSTTSSVRLRLLEKRAKLEAEKATHEKKILIEDKKLQAERELTNISREQKEMEINILETELSRYEETSSRVSRKSRTSNRNPVSRIGVPIPLDKCVNLNKPPNPFKVIQRSSVREGGQNAIPYSIAEFGQRSEFLMKRRHSEDVTAKPNLITAPPKTKEDVPLFEILSKQNEISLALLKNQENHLLPRYDLDVFDGSDITKFKPFINAFKKIIENRCSSEFDKFVYLEKYTRDHPHDLVQGCTEEDPTVAFQKAINLLNDHYGNEYRIAQAFVEKLEKWPNIKSEDGRSLEQLSIFLTSITNIMGNLSSLNQLNSPREIMNIIKKLPFDMRKSWRMKMSSTVEHGDGIHFGHLEEFVRKQSRALNLPIFGEIQDYSKTGGLNLGTRPRKSFATSMNTEASFEKSKHFKKRYCLCCKKDNHELKDCFFFAKKSNEDKVNYLKTLNLCFGCLKEGHRSRFCERKLQCEHCKKNHPSVLHIFEKEPRISAIDHHAESSASQLVCATKIPMSSDENDLDYPDDIEDEKMVHSIRATSSDHKIDSTTYKKIAYAAIPVKVRVQGSENCVETYMGLDGFSSDCFIDNALLKKLGVSGTATTINLTTMENKNKQIPSKIIKNLEIISLDNKVQQIIPTVFAQKNWPFSESDSPCRSDIELYPHMTDIPFNFINEKIGILAGINTPEILKPLEIVSGKPNELFASRHTFGWTYSGPVELKLQARSSCHRIRIEENDIENKIERLYSQDYDDENSSEAGPSIEDNIWLNKIKASIQKRKDGHYQIALPFREDNPELPCNYRQVSGRLQSLKRRFAKNPQFYTDYRNYMGEMLKNGFMEEVPDNEITLNNNKVWFLTHHGIYHKQKHKIRVVFDCSLKIDGLSLNDTLLQGPDLTNGLLGVLLRFREGVVAFMGDVEKMFFQIKVPPQDSNYMRFLWFTHNDMNQALKQYRITSHVFGAISSPSCANYALRHTASRTECKYNQSSKLAIFNNFYVDDLIKAVQTEDQAITMIAEIRSILSEGGFNLTGFVSNSRKVINSIPSDKRGKSYEELDFEKQELPVDRALGVKWSAEDDSLGFKINIKKHDLTRRGILSCIFSIYDPLGIAGPALIPAKAVFQEACRLKLSWDEKLPTHLVVQWQRWLAEAELLQSYGISRNIIPPFDIDQRELHIFCDGSMKAYGAVSYARFVGRDKQIHCSLLMAKVRLTPADNKTLKTIPRIELNSAKLAVILKIILEKELDTKFDSYYFWSDSLTVIKYINNNVARFQRFVANRIAFIRSSTEPAQWNHVPGNLNIADILSRGADVKSFIKNELWLKGPKFLWQLKENWPITAVQNNITDDDLEIKRTPKINTLQITEKNATDIFLEYSSCWSAVLCRVSALLRVIDGLKSGNWRKGAVSTSEKYSSELSIWRYIQGREYSQQILDLKRKGAVKKGSSLERLFPWIDGDGLLRVGGRLQNSMEVNLSKHPVVLPGKHRLVELMVRECHKLCGHMGSEYVLSVLREKYWIIAGNTLVKKITKQCIICRKIQGRHSEQLMANLPAERTTGGSPPFSHVGIDYFGPFLVSRGRAKASEKRYGVVFTCITSRAIHLEIACSLDTSSFINVLRRFVARRGPVKTLYSDNGTNLVGGCRVLKAAIDRWNQEMPIEWMKQKQITWKFNPPSASHFGGIWEREIRTTRKILQSMFLERPHLLNDDSLQTLMCEVESILNNRPLTSLSDDPRDMRPLTPNNILLLHSDQPLPPGVFDKTDGYHRQRWRSVQYLADEFWKRWRKQYLLLLQERQKWKKVSRSHRPGDLVLVTDVLLPRNQWCIGRISDVACDDQRNVRSARIKIAQCTSGRSLNVATTEIRRPISKLILLMPSEN